MDGDFRQMPILPSKQELAGFELSEDLPVNEIGVRRSSLRGYLHMHFKLLREDLIHPLREDIVTYRRSCVGNRRLKAAVDSTQDLRVYSDAKMVGISCGKDGIEYEFHFRISRGGLSAKEWQDSTRLEQTALLCISADHFQTYFWCVVVQRDLKDLAEGVVAIRVALKQGDDDFGFQSLRLGPSQAYVVVQSRSYFEAYDHVLKALQREEMESLPFKRNLLDLDTQVQPPSYLLRGNDMFDFSSVVLPSKKAKAMGRRRILQDWPPGLSDDLGLNETQVAALRQGLTKELAIIQGPPGTGKTFLGTMLVRLLLANRKGRPAPGLSEGDLDSYGTYQQQYESTGPILVICYKNHALDQFLEGLYKAGITDVIRMGSGSTSAVLEKRTLFHLLEQQKAMKQVDRLYHRVRGQASSQKHKLKEWIEKYIEMMGQESAIQDLLLEGSPSELKDLIQKYEQACKDVAAVNKSINAAMLRTASVVGVTSTAAAKYHDVLKSLNSQIVVMEEAAEMLEGHVVACLSPSVKHLILIGDHLQLRHLVQVDGLAKECNLEVSMFERLVCSGVEHITLDKQRRMRPGISKLVKSLYPKSKDHMSVHELEDVSGMVQNVLFFHHEGYERNSKKKKGSKANPTEAKLAVTLCVYLLNQSVYGPENITILTMYNGQLEEMRTLLSKTWKDRVKSKAVKIVEKSSEVVDTDLENLRLPRVSSVDKFQGEESDIIILSLVRNNEFDSKKGSGNIGFLRIENRICVALTRARKGLYILGNVNLLAKNSELWKKVVDNLKADGAVGERMELCCENHPYMVTSIAKVEDFEQVKDGGCKLSCIHDLSCGHACPQRCHWGSHDAVVCPKTCLKECKNGDHNCTLLCHGKVHCPPCAITVRRRLVGCNHEQDMPCENNLQDEICRSPCERTLPCGHGCHRRCGQRCTRPCEELVLKNLPCGHSALAACSHSVYTISCESPCRQRLTDCKHVCEGICGVCEHRGTHEECKQVCERRLVCGHSCQSRCSAACPPCEEKCFQSCSHTTCLKPCGELCTPCPAQCGWKCLHNECPKLCSEVCERAPCDEPCSKLNACGHPCIGLCGEPCLSKCRICDADTRIGLTHMRLSDFEEADRFLQLENCQHIFEVSWLDNWMAAKETSPQEDKSVPIILKDCPECRTTITKSKRYSNIVKPILKQIKQVKTKILAYENLNHGNDHLQQKRFSTALQFYEAALRQNPWLMEAHFQIACAHFQMGRLAFAVARLSFVLERSSLHSRFRSSCKRIENYTFGLACNGEGPGAIRAIKKQIAASPREADDVLATKAALQLASVLHSQSLCADAVLAVLGHAAVLEMKANAERERMNRTQSEFDIQCSQSMAEDVGERGDLFQCPHGHVYACREVPWCHNEAVDLS